MDHRSFIGGKWVEGSAREKFPVYGWLQSYSQRIQNSDTEDYDLDPVDNEKIWDVTDVTQEDVKAAIDSAQVAFKTYKQTTHRERRWLMRRWSDLIKANADDLAAICTLELGKPFKESLVTVKVCCYITA